MGNPVQAEYCYEIIVEGQLDPLWLDWFGNLALHTLPGGNTLLTGPLPDQAALRGVLDRIFDLNLQLISIRRIEKLAL